MLDSKPLYHSEYVNLKAKDRLILVRVKIERAKKHLLEFDTLAEAFDGRTYQIVVTNQDVGAEPVFPMSGGILGIREYPVASFELLSVAGDIIQNLRSSLDHLARQLAEVGTPSETPSDWVSFPIVRYAKDYEAAKVRKVQGMRPEAIKAIDALKPYQGGNDSLWRLHQLSNIDKHRFIFSLFRNGLFLGDGFDGHYWLQAKNPIFSGINQPKMDQKINFASNETLSQSEIGKSEPLLPFLHQITEYIDTLVGNFLPYL